MIINEQDALDEIQKLGFVVAGASYRDEAEAELGNHSSRFWKIPSENFKLEGTPFYKNTENDYVHFTSVENLFSILDSKCLRMYNLENMEDKFEMDHIRKKLKYPEFIEFDKKELYCLSMCCTSVLNSQMKEHLLWKLHGRNDKGVIIRFSFHNSLQRWYNFHLTKVFYNYKIAKPILRLNELTQREFLDPKIGCFFKLPIYKFENETRLIFENRKNFKVTASDKDGNLLYPLVYADETKKPENIFYIKLPLLNFNKNAEDLYKAPNLQHVSFEIPKIQIDEIIAGYAIDRKVMKDLTEKCTFSDPSIKIRTTTLKKYY